MSEESAQCDPQVTPTHHRTQGCERPRPLNISPQKFASRPRPAVLATGGAARQAPAVLFDSGVHEQRALATSLTRGPAAYSLSCIAQSVGALDGSSASVAEDNGTHRSTPQRRSVQTQSERRVGAPVTSQEMGCGASKDSARLAPGSVPLAAETAEQRAAAELSELRLQGVGYAWRGTPLY